MLKIYGVARSRAFRVLWMAQELGLDYEHVKVDFASGETRESGFLALNPNGRFRSSTMMGSSSGSRWRSTSISRRNMAWEGSIRAGSKTKRGPGNGAFGG